MIHDIYTIPLNAVCINGGTQSRAALNESIIAEYTEAIRSGIDLPPVITFYDGANYWLADGFHRYFAHKAAGAMEIMAEVREGTCRDAVLYSVGANASHGLRRTNDDKRRAVMTLLNDPEWSSWSDNGIAKACNVSDKTVTRHRAHLRISEDGPAPAIRTVERNGTVYEQNTANIGKVQPTDDSPVPESDPEAAPDPVIPDAEQDAECIIPISELEALREQLAEVADHLKSTMADNEMMGRAFDSDDRVKASMGEVKRQKAIADCAETQYNGQQGKVVALTKQVTHWMNRAIKAEKELEKLRGAK
ncbi:hypothetical protein [Glaciimonas sp. PAMC28666]|uniref:hypothetical protein n=1 Tax=Glaciimonas sp. PAMC28666 TaxID=2807626 RepID=UPI0019652EC3|nr:hypothetical protein [Glaciimonas sp. PAMC28666]QRX83266.1 hypothetical protein JQN73_03025 [Glaciimonas sp. PAMC28666]